MRTIETILSKKINKEIVTYFLDVIEKNPIENRKSEVKLGLNPNAKNQKECLYELYFPSKVDGEKEAQKDLIDCETNKLVSIIYRDKKSYLPLWKRKAIIVFNLEYEDICRNVLNKEIDNYKNEWLTALENSKITPNIKKELSILSPITLENKDAQELIERIYQYLLLKRDGDYIREASAYMFWGKSKVLDNRSDLWNVFKIKQHPIQILVFCATNKKNILFIENKQTFESLQKVHRIKSNYILIYLSGFMGTASRISNKEYRSAYMKYPKNFNSYINVDDIFEDESYNHYFWGDLDYEGVNIFIALKNTFPKVSIWEEGYNLMIEKLNIGEGHSAEFSKKEKQKYPKNSIEIEYINKVLLPIMDEKGFYDQEGILFT